MNDLTQIEREQIGSIILRRANEIASFSDAYRNDPKSLDSVRLALTHEIDRLRKLGERVNPPTPKE